MNFDAIRKILAKGGASAEGLAAKMKGMGNRMGNEAKGTYSSMKNSGIGSDALVPMDMAGAGNDPMQKRKKLLALLGLLGGGAAGAGALGGAGYQMMDDED